MRDIPFGKVTKIHPYAWLWEPLEGEPGFMLRPMFGGRGAYIDGRLTLLFHARDGAEWRGIFVCTAYGDHASLMAEFPALKPHSVLAKWLFLPEENERFEAVAEKLVALVKRRDPRIGVVGKPKKKRRTQKRRRGGPGGL